MMDPQSQSFTPSYNSSNENWRLQGDITRVQQIQAEHAERIARLERRQEDDARMKSVWGNQSPFPSVLSGTPQHGTYLKMCSQGIRVDSNGAGPLQQPHSDRFADFDDEANNLMSSLHLDAESEPRRGMGSASRANSVRFDESANQNYVSHSSRPSVDFLSRTSSGLGGLRLDERTSSHKSEGRASSAHSMRSAASGRANSLNLDTAAFGLGALSRLPSEVPPAGLAPGLMLLGAVPAIIRCWMNTNFKHDALLYAAVCTGSYRSFLDLRLIEKLGFETSITVEDDGTRVVELPVFFPEAVPHPASSRSSSPAPQLPSLTVEFRVIEQGDFDNERALQIFLGSDVLRAHNADILFSSNSMTIYDNERNKLSIPLSRPENESAFNTLFVASGKAQSAPRIGKSERSPREQPYLNGLGQASSTASVSSAAASPPPGKYRPPGAIAAESGNADSARPGAINSDSEIPTSPSASTARPSLTMLNTKSDRSEREEAPADAGSQTTPLRSGSSPAIWSNWRRDGAGSSTISSSGLDWVGASKSREQSYQRKDTGIKVLKPKTASRTFSTSATPTSGVASPGDGKSRFFDEGRRRSELDPKPASITSKENSVSAGSTTAQPKTKSNPIGGASAFSWLNSGGSK
ncbi:uncharacterized protein MYCFIDRAFT_202962 [Pseudocercospora fijiensis CIRAD86]|uniref:Ubiquitin carboxyl-terminal hydrolase 19 n=1 Tax=Pseudocercospora fijiensis (strain CIRAD86) TaxID=383855 RepID=M2ZZF1_PSEFD|nr:uncharacterized protein MYCFIDRAFT_202962 [Pseudocercospora fijiensis CIRAD86]EME84279.1 hypothetical protein MYCFIDRAFT_202962 [Pseudocercospora fijiensis CIRAD86]